MESFVKSFNDFEIITHSETKRLMLNNIQRYLSVSVKIFQDEIDTAKAELLRGTKADGTLLTQYEIKRNTQSVKDADYYLPPLKNSVFIPPAITFDSGLNIMLGNKEIQVRHFGRGNTPGDAFVYLPQEKILVTGDLLVYPIPYAFGCYPTEWIQTLKKMSELEADIIIPGHGNVLYSKDYLHNVIYALRLVTERVSKLAKDGMSLDEVKKNVNFEDLKIMLAGDDEDKKWAFDNYFIEPIIPRAFQEAKGTL
jgi:glyoxylase-like metal-dependent hydrolase (beta-lactamase superfamily II)